MAAMRFPALAAAALLAALPAAADEEVGEGLPAPAFSLRTLNPDVAGASWVSLDRFVGDEPEDPAAKVVLISFFASWCQPCRREMPFLVQLDRMYREHGLRVLGVDIDKEESGIDAAKKLIATAKVTYPVLSDRFNFLARRYLGEKAPLPSVFIVQRDGVVAKIERGYAKDASHFLLAEVQDALGLERKAGKQQAAAATPRARPAKAAAATPRTRPSKAAAASRK
jgi:thiol-disulfide isomerase/thioredoxin